MSVIRLHTTHIRIYNEIDFGLLLFESQLRVWSSRNKWVFSFCDRPSPNCIRNEEAYHFLGLFVLNRLFVWHVGLGVCVKSSLYDAFFEQNEDVHFVLHRLPQLIENKSNLTDLFNSKMTQYSFHSVNTLFVRIHFNIYLRITYSPEWPTHLWCHIFTRLLWSCNYSLLID